MVKPEDQIGPGDDSLPPIFRCDMWNFFIVYLQVINAYASLLLCNGISNVPLLLLE